jgi:proline racemase
MGEKRRWFEDHLDHLRTGLCLEPRGHRSLLIAVMTEPVSPEGALRALLHLSGWLLRVLR